MEKLTKAEKKEQRKAEWQEKLAKQQKEEKTKKFGIWGVVALIVLAVIFIFYKSLSSPATSTQGVVVPAVTKTDISTGPADAKAILIEYADFQCPGCAASYPMVKQLLTDYKGKLQFVYRFFPLIGIHKNARISAQAGYSAYEQDKFWEMEDLLFTKQSDWALLPDPEPKFVEYATALRLDVDKFKKDMVSGETEKFIEDRLTEAQSIGINSTPTFFLNGQEIAPASYDEYKQLIDRALSSK